jgi:hypothetical protein
MKKHRRRIFNREGAFEPSVRGAKGIEYAISSLFFSFLLRLMRG